VHHVVGRTGAAPGEARLAVLPVPAAERVSLAAMLCSWVVLRLLQYNRDRFQGQTHEQVTLYFTADRCTRQALRRSHVRGALQSLTRMRGALAGTDCMHSRAAHRRGRRCAAVGMSAPPAQRLAPPRCITPSRPAGARRGGAPGRPAARRPARPAARPGAPGKPPWAPPAPASRARAPRPGRRPPPACTRRACCPSAGHACYVRFLSTSFHAGRQACCRAVGSAVGAASARCCARALHPSSAPPPK